MSNLVFRLPAGLLAVLLVSGCLAASPQVAYYSLYAPEQKPASTPASDTPLAVSVGPITIPDILKQEKIATGGVDGRYRLAEYHRWSGELDRDFARALAEQLADNLGTERVAVFPWDQTIGRSCRVAIDILNMSGETGKAATLAVRWALVKPGEDSPILVRRSELSEVPVDASYSAWVAAQQRNISRLGQEIATAIRENLKP